MKTTKQIIEIFESIGHDPQNNEFANKKWYSGEEYNIMKEKYNKLIHSYEELVADYEKLVKEW